MEFLEAQWLWLLLVALPLLWFLRRARLHKPMSLGTYMLFERASQALPLRTSPRRPPWRSVLLFLPVVFLILLLARPAFRTTPREVLLLDRSASMGAVVGGRSRMAQAKEVARERGFDANDVIGVPAPAWKDDLFEATAAEGQYAELMAQLNALEREGTVVTVVTDLASPPGYPKERWVQVEGSAVNRGIVAFGLSEGGTRGLVRVVGDSGWASKVRVARIDRDLKMRETVVEGTMEPLATRFRLEFSIPPGLHGEMLIASLSADDNALDNEAYIVPMAREVSLRVGSDADAMLLRAFRAHPLIRVVADPLLAGLSLFSPETGESKPLRFAAAEGATRIRGDLHLVRDDDVKLMGTNLELLIAPLPESLVESATTLARLHGVQLLCDLGDAYWLGVPSIDPLWANDASFPLLIAGLVDHHAMAGRRSLSPRGPRRMPESLADQTVMRFFGGGSHPVGELKARSGATLLDQPGLYAPAGSGSELEFCVGIATLSEAESGKPAESGGIYGPEDVSTRRTNGDLYLSLSLALILTCMVLFRKRF